MNYTPGHRNIIFLALCCFVSSVFSQTQQFHFTHLTTDMGLSQANVTCILQDEKGFMWFGTFNGLNRYDGYKFEIFNYEPENPRSLSHNYISALFEDQKGDLWVGTSDGLNRYNRKLNRFRLYKHEEGNPQSIAGNQIESILEDKKGRLWIGTRNGGVDLFDPDKDRFFHPFKDQSDGQHLSTNSIRLLFEDSNDNLWIAHWNGAIDIVSDVEDDSKNPVVDREKLTRIPVTAIIESVDGSIWIATQGSGLFRTNYDNGHLSQIVHYSTSAPDQYRIDSDILLCLMIDADNRLWIGTEDKGINILDLNTGTMRHIQHDPFNPSSLNHNSVWKIYQDRAGNIWIGTYAHGINLLESQKSYFQHIKYSLGRENWLNHNMINAFCEDKNQNLWIATDGGGLNYFDRNKDTFEHYTSQNSNLGSDVIFSLLEDRRGRLWVGTWADGLYRFDRQKRRFFHYSAEEHGLATNRIFSILEDRKEGLWLATYWGGLTYFNPDTDSLKIYNKENVGLGDNYVRAIIQDSLGNLWIGTDTGVDYLNPLTHKCVNYKHDPAAENSLSKGFVNTIFQSRDGTVWIGTTGGLNKYDPQSESFVHYHTGHGLPNNEIKCIIEDNHGNLWLSTNKGISYFSPTSETFKNFDISDGLQGNEFNIQSGLATSAGEILFGGNNGFNILQSAELSTNTYVPPVFVTGFRVFNKPVAISDEDSPLKAPIIETDSLRLSYWQTVFSFDFVALNYVTPEKNQYAYMLEGFEEEWNYVGTTRTATYTNLDPGNYIFRVKASNNAGIWNNQGTAIYITIEPPFWKTWWAYAIEALLLLAVIGFLLNYFISRQRLRNALKVEHLQLEKLFEMDQMKTRFFSNISHELHSPLTLILSPLEKLVSSPTIGSDIQNMLKLVYRNALRLQRMTNQLRDFQKIESKELSLHLSRGNVIQYVRDIAKLFRDYAIEHHIRFEYVPQTESYVAWFDADKLDKIIYNLLSNAFKFTPDGGVITVTVRLLSGKDLEDGELARPTASQYLEICINDSGIGIPQDKIDRVFHRYYMIADDNGQPYEGSGVGLALVYELINLYQGKITVSSKEGEGTRFTVCIPLDEQFLEENQLVSEFSTNPINSYENVDLSMAGLRDSNQPDLNQKQRSAKEVAVILIVEDDREVRNYIKNSLEPNYRVVYAEDGRRGLKKAIKIIPDLIISDIRMPELSGIELCNRLKEDEKTSHIPIILLTADSSAERKIEGLRGGADAYVTKPFNIEILEAQIGNLLESRKKLREKFAREILLGPKKIAIKDIDEKFLQRVVEITENHISDSSFNAEMLCKLVGMSRMQLYRKLRNLTDQTVHEFIRSIRLKRAVHLLEEKRMTITEVAYEVGFNDLTYFARCFRKQYHKSPSEYASQKK